MVYDDGVEHSGYMSFIILLALFPFFIFLLSLTSFLGASELGEKFMSMLLDHMPPESIESIKSRINEIRKSPPPSLMNVAIVSSIWTASSFLEGIRTILNKVYKVSKPPSYLFRRFLSIIQFILMSILITVIMLMLIVIPIILAKVPNFLAFLNINYLPNNIYILSYFKSFLLFLALFSIALSLYYFIPNVSLTFLEVFPGATITSLLWMFSSSLLSSYLRYYNQLSIVYGSLGSIVITLLFFYIINIFFIYGAEFNYLYFKKDQLKTSFVA